MNTFLSENNCHSHLNYTHTFKLVEYLLSVSDGKTGVRGLLSTPIRVCFTWNHSAQSEMSGMSNVDREECLECHMTSQECLESLMT